jgi:quercetin dioxygenase-like cupin family protein
VAAEAAIAEDVLFQRGTTLVRRLTLAPGEAMPWHRDPFHRVTVVLRGSRLAIEDRESGERQELAFTPGHADWDEPSERVHRGVNVGDETYEEVTIFFLDRPDAVPQPSDG